MFDRSGIFLILVCLDQIIAIMRVCNLDDKMYTLRSWKNAAQVSLTPYGSMGRVV